MDLYFEPLQNSNNVLKVNKFYEVDLLNFLSIYIEYHEESNFIESDFRDYKLLREKPILKIRDGEYCILDLNFLVDKLYIGMIFNFYYKTSLRHRKDLYVNFADFLSKIGVEFAEKLFCKIVSSCFNNIKNVLKVPGGEFTEEYSDYYVRAADNIFLFEYKNYIINADIKASFNYDKIINGIYQKMVESESNTKIGKLKPKGVGQLIGSIEKINKGGFVFDKLDGKSKIYTFLIYTDEFFDTHGMQNIINSYFSERISRVTSNKQDIKGVLLISLSDLIRVSYTVNKSAITLSELVELYFYKLSQISRESRIRGKVLIVPHFSELLSEELIEMNLNDATTLISNILGVGFNDLSRG